MERKLKFQVPSRSLSLSHIFESNPSLSLSPVLDLRSLHIERIGSLSSVFENVETLDLSENNLSNLEGLFNFPYLRELSLSSNNIAQLTSLEPLFSLTLLEDLNLSGNPVSVFPIYRSILIYNLPSLYILDDTKVLPKERQTADKLIRKQQSLSRNLVENEEKLAKLENLQQKLKIHRQLIVGNVMEEYTGVNIGHVLSLINLPHLAELKYEVEEWVYERLNDSLKSPLSNKNWDLAWGECLEVQLDRISELVENCEVIGKECSMIFEGKKFVEVKDSFDPQFKSYDSFLFRDSPRKVDCFGSTWEENSFFKNVLASSPVNELNLRMSFIQKKSDHTNAMYSAIKDGLAVVVKSFRKTKLQSMAFRLLRAALAKRKQIRRVRNKSKKKWTDSVKRFILENWKKYTLHERIVRKNEYSRGRKRMQLVFNNWKTVTRWEALINKHVHRSEFKVKKRIFSALKTHTKRIESSKYQEESSLDFHLDEDTESDVVSHTHSRRSDLQPSSSLSLQERTNLAKSAKPANKRDSKLYLKPNFEPCLRRKGSRKDHKKNLSCTAKEKTRMNMKFGSPVSKENKHKKSFSEYKKQKPSNVLAKYFCFWYEKYKKKVGFSVRKTERMIKYDKHERLAKYLYDANKKKLLLKCFQVLKSLIRRNLHKRVKTLEKVVFQDLSTLKSPAKHKQHSFLETNRKHSLSIGKSYRTPRAAPPRLNFETKEEMQNRLIRLESQLTSRKQGLELVESIHRKLDVLENRLITKRRIL